MSQDLTSSNTRSSVDTHGSADGTIKLKVFISYSREDALAFADQLVDALDAYGFSPIIDRHGIAGGVEWEKRLSELIAQSDTVLFVLSPKSAYSTYCQWEVEETDRLRKRLIPIVCAALGNAPVPQRLKNLNYIFFYPEPKLPGSGFGAGLKALVAALSSTPTGSGIRRVMGDWRPAGKLAGATKTDFFRAANRSCKGLAGTASA